MSGSATLYQIGRLAGDPVSKMAGTTPVVEMRIVSSQGKGEKEKAQWVTASFFGKQGDLVKDLKKGDMIAFHGPLNVREYKTTAGEARTSLDVAVSGFTFLGGKKDDAPAGVPNAPF